MTRRIRVHQWSIRYSLFAFHAPQQKNNGRGARASAPSVFLRPFNGCVPQPEKKRRLFDSHNPNSLMVAELAALYQSFYA
jgi:hypothetical protein